MNARSRDQSKPQVVARLRDNRRHGDEDYPDVHFLGGKLVSVREVDVTMKAHQHHEGSPYSP